MSSRPETTSIVPERQRRAAVAPAYRSVVTWGTAIGFLYVGGRLSALEEPVLSYIVLALVMLNLSTVLLGVDTQRVSLGIRRAARRSGGAVTWIAVRAEVPESLSDKELRHALHQHELSGALLRHYDADGLEWWSLPRFTDAGEQLSHSPETYALSSETK